MGFTSCVTRISQIVRRHALSRLNAKICVHARAICQRMRLPREPIHFSTDFYLSPVRTRPVEQPRGPPLFAATLFISLDTALVAINRNGRAHGILWCRFADVDSPRERKSPFVPRDVDNYSCKRAVRVVGLRAARPLQMCASTTGCCESNEPPQRDGSPRARNARRSYRYR